MPVIKETRQFLTQPIGVARASRGGEITGEAISRAAGELNQIAFKFAAKDAEKRGEKQAKSIDSAQVTGIDPLTGGPKALSDLKGMGRIQAEAYERIIDRRFEESMEQEMRLKSKEIALSNPDPEKYDTLMSSYMADMANGAKGTPYSEYIANTGTLYLNQTKLVLKDEAIKRAKIAQKKAEARALADRKDLAFNLGHATGSGNEYTTGEKGLEKLGSQQAEASGDLEAYTGSNLPSELVGANDEIVDQYISGFAQSSLTELSRENRTNLFLNLTFGKTRRMDAKATAVYDRIVALTDGEPLRLANAGARIAPKINVLNSTLTSAEIDQDLADAKKEIERQELAKIKSDNLESFELTNLNLASENEDEVWLNTSLANSLSVLDSYRVDNQKAINAGVSPTEVKKRIAQVGSAENQIVSAAILRIADKIPNMTEVQLSSIRNGIQNKDLSNLYELAGNVSESDKVALQSLLERSDPATAMKSLESQKVWESGESQRKVKAANLNLKENLPTLLTDIYDGNYTDSDVDELLGGSAESTDRGDAVNKINAAIGETQLRNILIPEGGFTYEDKGVLSEAQLLASGTDIPEDATPLLNKLGFRKPIVKILNSIKDVDSRKSVISSLLDRVPSDQTASIRDQQFQEHLGKGQDLIQSNDDLTLKALNQRRQDYIKSVNADSLLKEDQKISLINGVDSSITASLTNRVMSSLSQSERERAAAYVLDPDAETTLSSKTKKLLDLITSSAASGSDRQDIAGDIVSNMGKFGEADKANKNLKNSADSVKALVNGFAVTNTPENVESIQTHLLQEAGLTEVPLDLFQNGPEYLAASRNENDPKHAGGNLLISMLRAAGDNGVIFPQIKSLLSKGAMSGSIGNTPIDPVFLADIISNIAYSRDTVQASIVRSSLFNEMGLDDTTQGVLEGLADARILGFDEDYMARISQGLQNPKASLEAFNLVMGSKNATAFIQKAIPYTMHSDVMGNPDMVESLTSYAVGLQLSGMNQREIKSTIRSHLKDTMRSDDFTISNTGSVSNLSPVNIERSFGNNASKSAALGLHQIEMWAEMGEKIIPDGTLAEQIKQGSIKFKSEYKTVATGRNLVTIRSGLKSQKAIVYVPRYSDTNATAVYTAYTRNPRGDIDLYDSGVTLKASDSRVSKLAIKLSALDEASKGIQGDDLDPLVIENAIIQFYLESANE